MLESEATEYKKTRTFHTALAQLAHHRGDVNVRLKTFRTSKKTSGEFDCGRYAWDQLEKISVVKSDVSDEASEKLHFLGNGRWQTGFNTDNLRRQRRQKCKKQILPFISSQTG